MHEIVVARVGAECEQKIIGARIANEGGAAPAVPIFNLAAFPPGILQFNRMMAGRNGESFVAGDPEAGNRLAINADDPYRSRRADEGDAIFRSRRLVIFCRATWKR